MKSKAFSQLQRIKDSSLGPVLKATEDQRLVFRTSLLIRSLTILKENELWFHFGGQPMKFSITEFHMVTRLKCSPSEGDEDAEHNRYDWENTEHRHTSDELLEILRNTDRNSGDERFFFAMLLLTESIFLNMFKGYTFHAANLKRAQDVNHLL
ncbi:hypothetical protein ARALYDRAFT_351375 [Arabidopsis lyrata subsp. lyrata]|uniref:DUF1985 domain-containing protein n=1 Tax=Arabidopsis lyrata subsp. lyrata TaxID=81972 RepID=D7M2B0_ARALL|nr:hypothetical protein ARALYDRAFT_351375 [Arabidopsis lyrata subsp. lyrata]